jgi:HSP20 family protein
MTTEPKSDATVPAGTTRRGLLDLRGELDRLWEAVAGSPWTPFRISSQQWMPATDVYEKDGQLHIRVELPGLTEKDVEISATADSLTISGEKGEGKEVKEENCYRSERSYGRFTRRIPLPPGAQADQASARLKDGVLEIDIPLTGETSPKVIEIKGGGA